MHINGIGANKIVSLYGKNKNSLKNGKVNEVKTNDSIHISSVGKSLSSYSIDDKFINSTEKIEKIRLQVSNGTYNRDSKLIAQSLIDHIKSLK